MKKTLTAYVEGIGLLGPGLIDWPSSQAALSGREAYQPQKTEKSLGRAFSPAIL